MIDYPELLMWDQLRGVMKDPDNNPFPGFSEGPIDFPPTFKVKHIPMTALITSTMFGNPYERPIGIYVVASNEMGQWTGNAKRVPRK
jgi:hypothetical protein